MHSAVARRCAVALMTTVVATIAIPRLSHATNVPQTRPSNASPHASQWTRPGSDIGSAAKQTFQGRTSSSPLRRYESTNAPNPCYYSVWFDPQDAPELDAASYAALYDCPSGSWSFPVSTRDNWASSELDFYGVLLETDGNFNDGCDGADYALEAIFASGSLQAALLSLPSCNSSDWAIVAQGSVSRTSASQISIGIPNSALGSPSNLRWLAELKGVNETTEQDDLIPDTGSHQEDGYVAGSSCTVGPAGTATPSSYTVVDDPEAAAAVLRSDGEPDVQPAGSRPGVVHFSGDPARAGAALARAGINANVSPERLRHYAATPNDTNFSQQWSLAAVKASQAWDVTTGLASVVVGDLDSGVDPTHPDLQGKLVAGYDVLTGQPLSTTTNSDPVGHGTATAGIIGAATNNSAQLASLGYATSVMPVKIGDANGALSSNTATGVQWATAHGAKIINLSVGSECVDANEHAAVNYAQAHGVMVVASAGNNAMDGDRPTYPAAYPGVLAVGATDSSNAPTSYSEFGNWVDMVAPGGIGDNDPAHDILVLAPGGGLALGAGTSFSAPLAAAAGALLLAVNPALTGASVRSLLVDTATDIGPPGRDARTGAGLLNAALAVQTAALRAKYNPLPPSRILDTRNGTGSVAAPLGPNQTRLVKATGVANVPASGVSAVVMNVTAVSGSAGSFLTVYPSDVSRPLASNLNFPPGLNIPNLVVVEVGGDGNVALYNAQGTVDVLFDVVGWYGGTGDSFNALTPARVLDTRNGSGPLGPGQFRPVNVAGVGGVPVSGVTAVVLNVTAVAPSAASFLTLYPSDVSRPTASNLNFPPGVNIPNLVVVKVGSDGKVDVYNDQGTVDVVFDVVGWYGSTGSSYAPLPPHRVVDTRDGTGTPLAPLAGGETRTIHVAGVGGVPGSGISGVVLNLTAVSPSAGSYLTAYPTGVSRPVASNLNFGPGQIIPNLVFVKVGSGGNVDLYNDQGRVDVIFDVVGWFT
jgi:subtilisin family serine protease